VLVNSVVQLDQSGHEIVRSAIFDATERRSYERELVAAKERAERSEQRALLLAQTLQRTLIPPAVPVIAGLDLGAAYHSAAKGDEIGGDFYDVIQVAIDDWAIVIGDVQGKGVDAAIVTALLRHTTRAAVVEHRSPSEVLQILNTALNADATERSCTALVARLCRRDGTWTMTVAAAGHPLPVLRRRGRPPETIGEPGTLLGLFDLAPATDAAIDLRPGDEIVMYTDGVSEARRGSEWFGEAGMLASLDAGHASAAAAADGLLRDVLAFQPRGPRDDIGIVVLRVP
jgi:sigma-B regulation protein RsbU (phosphoserine phosphatase)